MHNVNKRSSDDQRDEKGVKPWWQPGLLLFGRLSGWIVGPVILAVILGKWLDNRFGTKPWLFLATVGVAFAVSMIGLVREGMQAIKQAEKEGKKEPKDSAPDAGNDPNESGKQ